MQKLTKDRIFQYSINSMCYPRKWLNQLPSYRTFTYEFVSNIKVRWLRMKSEEIRVLSPLIIPLGWKKLRLEEVLQKYLVLSPCMQTSKIYFESIKQNACSWSKYRWNLSIKIYVDLEQINKRILNTYLLQRMKED